MLADLCRNRIVLFAMPPQDELGLLFQVLEIGHVDLHDEIVGGHCPSAKCRCSYMRRPQYLRPCQPLSTESEVAFCPDFRRY